MMYTATRFFYPNGIEGESMDNTVKQFDDIEKAIKLKEQGLSHEEVAKELGISRATLRVKFKEHNISFDKRKVRTNYNIKVLDLDIDQILKLKSEGVPTKDIATFFNVNCSSIERRLRNPDKYRKKQECLV